MVATISKRIERHIGGCRSKTNAVARKDGVVSEFPMTIGAVMLYVPEGVPTALRRAAHDTQTEPTEQAHAEQVEAEVGAAATDAMNCGIVEKCE